ncbi:MAG: hypothetical protein AB7O67_03000 [Vicinamibacterales bacterium]
MAKDTRPAKWMVAGCLGLAGTAMAVAVYFGGTGHLPIAMTGTILFVTFGGLGFELARRRSV